MSISLFPCKVGSCNMLCYTAKWLLTPNFLNITCPSWEYIFNWRPLHCSLLKTTIYQRLYGPMKIKVLGTIYNIEALFHWPAKGRNTFIPLLFRFFMMGTLKCCHYTLIFLKRIFLTLNRISSSNQFLILNSS